MDTKTSNSAVAPSSAPIAELWWPPLSVVSEASFDDESPPVERVNIIAFVGNKPMRRYSSSEVHFKFDEEEYPDFSKETHKKMKAHVIEVLQEQGFTATVKGADPPCTLDELDEMEEHMTKNRDSKKDPKTVAAENRSSLRIRFVCTQGNTKFHCQVCFGINKDMRYWHLRRRQTEITTIIGCRNLPEKSNMRPRESLPAGTIEDEANVVTPKKARREQDEEPDQVKGNGLLEDFSQKENSQPQVQQKKDGVFVDEERALVTVSRSRTESKEDSSATERSTRVPHPWTFLLARRLRCKQSLLATATRRQNKQAKTVAKAPGKARIPQHPRKQTPRPDKVVKRQCQVSTQRELSTSRPRMKM